MDQIDTPRPNNLQEVHLSTHLNDPNTLTQGKSNYKPNNQPKTTPDQVDHSGKTTTLKRKHQLQVSDRIGNAKKRAKLEEERPRKQTKATSKQTDSLHKEVNPIQRQYII